MNSNYIKRVDRNLELPPLPRKMTLRQLLAARCAQYPVKTFLLDPLKKIEYSYAAFQGKVNAVSNLLWRMGIRKDDKVSLLMPSTPEFLWSYLGIMQLGAVACPVNLHLKENELAHIINNSDSVALFLTADFVETALHLQAEGGSKLTLLLWQGAGERETYHYSRPLIDVRTLLVREKAVLRPEVSEIPLDPDDVAQLIYTSGTTGRPKGAMLTHHNLIIDAHWIAARYSLQEQDRAMCIMPLFHINGQVVTVITPLYHGGSIVLPERFSVTNFFPDIIDYGVTYTGTVATMLSMLLNRIDPVDMHERSKLRVVFCGSAPVPVEVQAAFERAFKVPVIEGYGMTETACRSTFNLLPPPGKFKLGESDGYRKLGSAGLPLGNELMVVDDQDRPLAAGQIGEIVIRGENVMKGYYKNPRATAEAFRHGWFHSGDLGYYDEDGYFFIVDRKNDMIIRGGENIYPREIEEVLYSHPAVKDAAVTGIPHPLYGEEAAAFVVLKDNARAGAEEIISFCAARLAAFKCPRQIKIVEQIPKSSSGKLLRRKLREML
ncbi:MAG: class I adenylate-forming enzyme family protein [Bacillota bacterium]